MAKLNTKRIIKQASKVNSRLQKQRIDYYKLRQKYYKKREQAQKYDISIGEPIKIPKVITQGSIYKLQKSINSLDSKIKIEKTGYNADYRKKYKKLLKNIDKVAKEGYTINVKMPQKPKHVTSATLNHLEELNKKVLQESTRLDKERGEQVTRKAVINRERNKRASLKRSEKALQQGKTLSDSKRKELLNERLSNGGATVEPLALNDIRVIKYIDRVEETFFRLEHTVNRKGEVNRGLIEWIMDWRSIFHDWVNSHSDAERMAAFKQVKWSKFMVKYYSSDGVGLYDFLADFENEMLLLTGIQPNIDISDVDLTDYEQYIAQDLGV